jgi:hypothetical protein
MPSSPGIFRDCIQHEKCGFIKCDISKMVFRGSWEEQQTESEIADIAWQDVLQLYTSEQERLAFGVLARLDVCGGVLGCDWQTGCARGSFESAHEPEPPMKRFPSVVTRSD